MSDTPQQTQTGEEQLTETIHNISVMNKLAEVGIEGVQARVDHLGDGDQQVKKELVKTGYVDGDTLEDQFTDHPRAGILVRLPEPPFGYIAILFSEESANAGAAIMLERDFDDLEEVSDNIAESALTELSKLMASGFVDAWSETFDGEIEIATPVFVHNTERKVVDRILHGVSSDDDTGVYLTTRLQLFDPEATAQIFIFPDTPTFCKIVDLVDYDSL